MVARPARSVPHGVPVRRQPLPSMRRWRKTTRVMLGCHVPQRSRVPCHDAVDVVPTHAQYGRQWCDTRRTSKAFVWETHRKHAHGVEPSSLSRQTATPAALPKHFTFNRRSELGFPPSVTPHRGQPSFDGLEAVVAGANITYYRHAWNLRGRHAQHRPRHEVPAGAGGGCSCARHGRDHHGSAERPRGFSWTVAATVRRIAGSNGACNTSPCCVRGCLTRAAAAFRRYVKNAKEEADFVQGRAKDVQAKIEALVRQSNTFGWSWAA
eukprot:361689-Chlamydomonas_euryale.AAC.12